VTSLPLRLLREIRSTQWSPGLVAVLAVYFVFGAVGLARLAVSFYLKDRLGLTPAEVSSLLGIAMIPWTIKPLYGWISDTYPIQGFRRRPYLFLAGCLGVLGWSGLALWAESLGQVVGCLLICSLASALGDVVADSWIVEQSRQSQWANTSVLQSLSWSSTALGSLLTAYLGGLLLERYSPQVVFGVTAFLPLVNAVAAWIMNEEGSLPANQALSSREQIQRIWQAIRQPVLYLPIGFIFLWQGTPSSEAAFFYFVTNDLGFGPEFLGQVQFATSLSSLLGVVIFQTYLKRIPFRSLFAGITLLSAGLGLTSLILVYHTNRSWGIDDHWFSLGDSVILAMAGQIAFMPILVLAARLCPAGIEATLFALLMSVWNASHFVSRELGSLLMQGLGLTSTNFAALDKLIWITNLSTLLPLACLGWIPNQIELVDSQNEGREHVEAEEKTA
jgi:folate/biopterin transporter